MSTAAEGLLPAPPSPTHGVGLASQSHRLLRCPSRNRETECPVRVLEMRGAQGTDVHAQVWLADSGLETISVSSMCAFGI